LTDERHEPTLLKRFPQGCTGVVAGLSISRILWRRRSRAPKQPITIRLDKDVVAYFKSMSAKTGVPSQNLINLYLRVCAEHGRELKMRWAS
jgi:hypothetical protein